MKSYIFVANWKMYPSFTQMATWCNECADDEELEWLEGADVIICPESTYFPFIYTALSPRIQIGAQDCSVHTDGAFTGEVSAVHLAEVDIFHTIIGHHELRTHHHETPATIAQKCAVAIKNGLTPIVCVPGADDAQEIFAAVQKSCPTPKTLICAYEPPASIGTGIVAENADIDETCEKIRKILEKEFPKTEIAVLYGGSVNEENVKNLRVLRHINGLLIGKASTDFQAFKKIVSFFMNKTL